MPALRTAPFSSKRYGTFEAFIAAIEAWISGPGADSAQLCGCATRHSYGSAWTSFKLRHFGDDRWNGPYVVNADTTREALEELVELVRAGTQMEDLFDADRTAGGTRTVRVKGRPNAGGFYVYSHDQGVPLFAEQRRCEANRRG